jgi:L-amino acid N-acyltransferase YncA
MAAIHVRSWEIAYRGLIPDAILGAHSIDARERQHREALGSPEPERARFVAEREGRVIGFAMVGPSRDDDAPQDAGELQSIYVDPADIGSGAGRQLLARATDELRARRYREMMLWVLPGNMRARRFYEAAGMATDGGEKTEEVRGALLPHLRYRMSLQDEHTRG